MNVSTKIILLSVTIVVSGLFYFFTKSPQTMVSPSDIDQANNDSGEMEIGEHPLSIEVLRSSEFPGSELIIEQTLSPGSNYERYIASYKSEGLKIFGLLTIPNGTPPKNGWPTIIFNHGYIPPTQYKTTEKYIAYTDAFSRNGYILFRPDYRGHGNSEGTAVGGYGSNAYTIDVLNALASIKRYNEQISSDTKIVDVNRIGMWGHSMGGHITLRSMVVSKDIKAGVIWAGVVGSYPDLLNNWRRRNPNASPLPSGSSNSRSWRQQLATQYGEPDQNQEFWNSISATSFVSDISGPVALHHGTADASVPIAFSRTLEKLLRDAGKEVEIFEYLGDDHNLSANLTTALTRSVTFFDKHLKSN